MSGLKLKIVSPPFDSNLNKAIFKLEKLRYKRFTTQVHPYVFIDLKAIFQLLETLSSARIEGNRTTVSELVESMLDKKFDEDEQLREIYNLQKAQKYIDETLKKDSKISLSFILNIHKIVVNNLVPQKDGGEGSNCPGELRKTNNRISGASVKTPDYTQVEFYLQQWVDFVNEERDGIYKPLVVAIAHHAFTWIHPFDNGNGRVVRLMTYAMMIMYGYGIGEMGIINPSTIVFCNDRQKYYDNLSLADEGKDENILIWCEYVLENIVTELKKIDRLTDFEYTFNKVIIPSLDFSLERKIITPTEYLILKLSGSKGEVSNVDIRKLLPEKKAYEISKIIRKLVQKDMLTQVNKSRKYASYAISFANSYLLRGVIFTLRKEGFISIE